jgi:hypothetical protein
MQVHLGDDARFQNRGSLILSICNGFQLTRLPPPADRPAAGPAATLTSIIRGDTKTGVHVHVTLAVGVHAGSSACIAGRPRRGAVHGP